MPFPHVERPVLVPRPALIVARHDTGAVGVLLWTMMVTNAARPSWNGDVHIPDAVQLGLLIPSKVRTAKISTVEESASTMIGRLDAVTWGKIMLILAKAWAS